MHTILAQAQAAGLSPYFSLAKIISILLLYLGWSFAAQWVDRDADRVKTKREWWNLLVLGGGLGGLAVLLLLQWTGSAFFLGLAFWVVLSTGSLIAYVVHRNGRLVPASRVLTPMHFKRVLAGAKGDGKSKIDKGIRVRMLDAQGKPIDKPADPLELERFDVAQDFLFDMLWKRATDADVLIGTDSVRVVHKIDGVVAEQPDGFTREDAERLLAFVKVSAGLNTEERRRPQTGTMRVGLLGATGKPEPLDVLTSGSTAGERLRLRLNRTSGLMKLEDLGFSEENLKKFKSLVAKDSGLVVFAGPKESGITTVMYATLRAHDGYMQNIYTLEKKPSLKLDNVTQQVYDTGQTEISYARALQTAFRREPDVVMIDQCEDRETAQLACRAAVEKKVYMAMRGANSFDALTRLLALVEDPKLVSESLIGVVGQRLIRVLCENCREAYLPDEQLLRKANLPVDQIENFYRPPSTPIVDKKGREIICQTCQNSHYVGRTGTFELLVVSPAFKAMVAAGAQTQQLKAQARSEKMRYLQEEGLLKVMAATTSMAEVMRGLRVDAKESAKN